MSDEEELRARLLAALEGVEGWFDPTEAWQLHEEVRLRLEAPGRPVTVVEIGSWMGRSAIALGLGTALRPGGGRVFAVDPHTDADHRFEGLRANLRDAGVNDVVEPVRATSSQARDRFPDGTVDFLFVDGDHRYESVVGDIEVWRSALAPGAIVAFNDVLLPGVGKAIADRILTPGSPFRTPRYVFGTIWFDYMPGPEPTPADRIDAARLRAFLLFGRSWLPVHLRVRDDVRLPAAFRRAELRLWTRALWNLFPRHDRARWVGS